MNSCIGLHAYVREHTHYSHGDTDYMFNVVLERWNIPRRAMKMRTSKSQLVSQFLPIRQNSITSKCVRAKDKSKSESFLELLLMLLLTLLYCRHRRRRQWWWRRQWYRHPSNRFWLTQNAFCYFPYVCQSTVCISHSHKMYGY